MSSRLLLPAVVLAALGLAACTSSEEPAPASTSVTISPASSGGSSASAGSGTMTPTPAASPSPIAPSPATAPSATTTAATAAPILVLRPDGLDLVSTSGARLSRIDFGTATSTQVDKALALALGGTAPKREDLPECGQGARKSARVDRFSVLYDGTSFVGWTDQGVKGHRLTAANGLGIGSTLAQVKAAQPDTTTMNDSLGPEFFSETGISGMLDGLKASSKVTLTYAGETCFFR